MTWWGWKTWTKNVCKGAGFGWNNFVRMVGMGLYFGWNSGLIIQRCFCICWAGIAQRQGLFCFLYCHSGKDVGVHWKWGWDTSGIGNPNWPEVYSRCGIILSIKLGGEGGRMDVWSDGICLPKSPLQMMGSCSSRGEHLPTHGKQWIHSLFYFACRHSFCFSYQAVFISIQKFSSFYAFILPHITLVGEWANIYVGLGCWLSLNHKRKIF